MATRSSTLAIVVGVVALAGCGQAERGALPIAKFTASVAPQTVKEALQPPTTQVAAPAKAAADKTPPVVTPPAAAAPAGTPPDAAQPRPGVPTFDGAGKAAALRYRFQEGKTYTYRVHIEADRGESTQIYDGTAAYTASAAKPQPAKPADDEHKPTATAFVVHPDGYLLTCEHVVEDAQKVEVVLGGKTYTAKVLGIDEPNDLALIRIEATNLPVLPITNSDGIEVGQDVRAIGFPLSSILGDSLKATRGTVSGIGERRGQRLLQVDASINPGNSGGPLVNESGEVVGVASAKLAGNTISNVGFAVPINYARALLEQQKVKFVEKQNSPRLDGPVLVRTVSPAVALVTITSRGTPVGERYRLKFRGSLASHERQNPQAGRSHPGLPTPYMGPRSSNFNITTNGDELEIDSAGNILESTAGTAMPCMLGNLMHLAIEPLPIDGRDRWDTHNGCTIHEKQGNDSNPFGPGFMRRPFGRFGGLGDTQVTKHEAEERTEYALGDKQASTIVIQKQYELKTDHKEGELPYLQLSAKGEITFDLQEGVPQEMTYKGTVTVSKQSVTSKVPVTLTYKLIDPAEVAAAEAARKAAAELAAKTQAEAARKAVQPPANAPNQAAAPNQAVAPRPDVPADPAPVAGAAPNRQPRPRPAQAPPAELPGDDLARTVASATSDNHFERKAALEKLAATIPTEEKRAEVAKAIEPFIVHSDLFARVAALKALGTWGGKENVPAILETTKHACPFTRKQAVETLVKLKDDRSIEPLVELYKDFFNRGPAGAALLEFGPQAEKAVQALLLERDYQIKKGGCELLEKIGTKESVAALEVVSRDSNRGLQMAADAALKAIAQRGS